MGVAGARLPSARSQVIVGAPLEAGAAAAGGGTASSDGITAGEDGRGAQAGQDPHPGSVHHSVTSLCRCAWHSMVTATGSDVMWQG